MAGHLLFGFMIGVASVAITLWALSEAEARSLQAQAHLLGAADAYAPVDIYRRERRQCGCLVLSCVSCGGWEMTLEDDCTYEDGP